MIDLIKFDSEITSRCNSACPLCPRTGPFNGLSDIMHKTGIEDIEVNDWVNILLSDAGKNIGTINYCGNYGDPMMHPRAMDIFELVHSFGVKVQRPDTNGGMRSKNWWSKLGKLNSMRVNFAIDGLSDTNSIYRVNTNFEKIIDNASAFINAGGYATWVYIVFKHNQHQVEEARELSKKIGFKDFKVKITSRNYDGKKENNNHRIDFPTDEKYQADVIKKGRIDVPITCKSIEYKQLYLTSDRLILPCCHVHSGVKHACNNNINREPEFYNFLKQNKIKYDLKHYTFDEIYDSYNQNLHILKEHWNKRTISTCNRKCGSNYQNNVI